MRSIHVRCSEYSVCSVCSKRSVWVLSALWFSIVLCVLCVLCSMRPILCAA